MAGGRDMSISLDWGRKSSGAALWRARRRGRSGRRMRLQGVEVPEIHRVALAVVVEPDGRRRSALVLGIEPADDVAVRIGAHVVQVGLTEEAANVLLVHPILDPGEGLARHIAPRPRLRELLPQPRVVRIHGQGFPEDVDRALVVTPLRDELVGEPDILVALHLDRGLLKLGQRLALDGRIGVDELGQPAIELGGEDLGVPGKLRGSRSGAEIRPLSVERLLGLLEPGPLGCGGPARRLRPPLFGRATTGDAGDQQGRADEGRSALPESKSFTADTHRDPLSSRGTLPQPSPADKASLRLSLCRRGIFAMPRLDTTRPATE